jgi:hypothetical protein
MVLIASIHNVIASTQWVFNLHDTIFFGSFVERQNSLHRCRETMDQLFLGSQCLRFPMVLTAPFFIPFATEQNRLPQMPFATFLVVLLWNRSIGKCLTSGTLIFCCTHIDYKICCALKADEMI